MLDAGPGPAPRHEFKLRLATGTAADVRWALRALPDRLRSFVPARAVNTIYFDTPELACLAASVEGRFDRYKLRLRWYGPDDPHEVFVEWKMKRGALGSKRRFSLPWSGPLAGRAWSEVRELLRAAVPAGLHPSLSLTRVPTLFNRYDRTYLETADRRCRVTVDERLAYLAPPGVQAVRLGPLIPRSGVIVEVKVQAQDRRLAEGVLQRLHLRPQRYSKYAETLGDPRR